MSHNSSLTPNETLERLLALSVRPEDSASSPGKPPWLKTAKVHGERLFEIKRNLRKGCLHTVCEEAKCPNISECMNTGTATFMILGDICTRGCRFCNVRTGHPGGVLDPQEPQRIASSVKAMGLDYVVITMVDRDDLADGGSRHIADTVRAVKEQEPDIHVEVLAGDFCGNEASLREVVSSGIAVFAHNLETVRSLTPRIRDRRATYERSLKVLKEAKMMHESSITKSGIMLGLGERLSEIEECLRDMREAGVDILTIGQYLRPSPRHFPVDRYAHPDEFAHWQERATQLGFSAVASGPLVRSSYRAAHLFPRRKVLP